MVLAETLCIISASRSCSRHFRGVPSKIRFWGFRAMVRFCVVETHKTDYFYWSREPTRFELLNLRVAARTEFHCQFVFSGKTDVETKNNLITVSDFVFSPLLNRKICNILKLFPGEELT